MSQETKFEKRLKKIERFYNRLKNIKEGDLLDIRQNENENVYESKEKIRLIDKEFSRRKPFYSAHDEMVDESIRSSDTTKCAIYDCDEPSEYYTLIGVKNERYGIFACRKHTQTLYEPTHRCLGNTDASSMKRKK